MAGGNWRIIEEKVDLRVVKQQDNLSCGVACGEMLLKERGITDISQAIIVNESGVPVSPAYLASVLNQLSPNNLGEWRGGGLEIEGLDFSELLDCLISNGVWIAELRELGARLAHLVVVDGVDDYGRILIEIRGKEQVIKWIKRNLLIIGLYEVFFGQIYEDSSFIY